MLNAITVTIIIIVILYIYAIKFMHPNYVSVDYNIISKRAKSGDIILFSTLESWNQIYMGSYFTHIGVIYRKDAESKPVLVESFNKHRVANYPKQFNSGIAICDLETRLNSYKGFMFYKQLAKPISESANKDFADFIKYSKKNIEYDENPVSNEIYKLLFNQPFNMKTNCGQFTVLILIKLGLLPFSNFRNRKKHHLRFAANLIKLKQNSYKEPVYISQKCFKPIEI